MEASFTALTRPGPPSRSVPFVRPGVPANRSRYQPQPPPPPVVGTRPWRRGVLLLATDALALGLAGTASWAALTLAGYAAAPDVLLLAGAACLGLFALAGLYPTFPHAPAEEIDLLATTTTGAFGVFAVGALAAGDDALARVLPLACMWLLTLVMAPLARATTRSLFARRSWWGCPVVVLGAGPVGRRVVQAMRARPELGLRPVALLDDDVPSEIVPPDLHAGPLSHALRYASDYGVRYCVLAAPRHGSVEGAIERYGRHFRRVLVVPDLEGLASLWVGARNVGGALGFEMEQRLHSAWYRVKRTLDIALAALLFVPLLPVLALLAVLIRLDSSGPVFYIQRRLGRGGSTFRLFKFRTMHVGAHERLQEVLDSDPEARREYETYAKLTNDPRVTRVGRFLRKYSLDELPQLLNVLNGSMSLVGPRAYMPEELPKMNGCSGIVTRVTPGITGLWQVSGRNTLSFDERVRLDTRYVQNWSFSLDLYLLARTVPTVLFGHGAL